MLQQENIEVDAINDKGETPLYIAIREDNLYIAELLLNAGADPNRICKDGDFLIHIAARHGKAHIVGMLLKYGVDVNSMNRSGETPLICALKQAGYQKGTIDIVDLLIEKGAEVNACDKWGKSALYYAIKVDNTAIVEMLLEADAKEE